MMSSRIIDDWVEVNPNRVVTQGDHESEFSDFEEVTRPESPRGWEFIRAPSMAKQGEKLVSPKVNDTVTVTPAVPKMPQQTGPSIAQASSTAPVPPHLGYKQTSKIPKKAPLRQTQPSVNAKGDQDPHEKKRAPRRRRKGKKTAPAETQEMGARVAPVPPHLRGKNRKQ